MERTGSETANEDGGDGVALDVVRSGEEVVGASKGEPPRPPAEEGPRERLCRLGATSLTDVELVAALLGTGQKGRPVQELARELLRRHGGLKPLVTRDARELRDLPGLGPAKASALTCALEIGRRVLRVEAATTPMITPDQVYDYLVPELGTLRREVFHVLCFNARGILIRDARVAEGSVDACPVDPREVFAEALSARASGIVLAHNHPSGDPEPSRQDRELTAQLWHAARLLNVKLLDHLILGDGCYVSFAEKLILPPPEETRSWRAASGGW